MKHLFRKSLILFVILLTGCFSNESTTSKSSTRPIPTILTSEYDYDDVKDKTIYWSNIFSITNDDYYVYFFSKTCSHCQSLKDFVVKKAIERGDIYFVESSDQDIFLKDVSSTIGLTSVEGFGILGHPSLIEITNKTIIKNIAGIQPIRSELSIE